MKFHLDTSDLLKQPKTNLIIAVYEDATLSSTAKKIDKMSAGYLTRLLKHRDFEGKLGQTLALYQIPHVPADRILLVGCGKNTTLSPSHFRKVVASTAKALKSSKITRAISFLTDIPIEQYDLAWQIKQTAELLTDFYYRFDQYKTQKSPATLTDITIHIDKKANLTACHTALRQGVSIASGVEFTKNLANHPSNICTPTYLAEQAKKLAKSHPKMSVKILGEKDMKKLGMNALLAVAQGSQQEAKLICLEYKGANKKQAPVALVGKGITFDTGGISLKTPDGMLGMKYDMCGAATVLGTLSAAAQLKLPINLVGIIASTENMPSGSAYKPEDIVTSMSGQTIEILNTDAEGRVILSDALTYCERFKPDAVIDIATLTGAVVIALGIHASAVLSNHDPLAQDLLKASEESGDRAWQLPLWEEYQEQIKSPFADMANTGGRSAGTITAACFLSRFSKKFHWAHLDVAGTAAVMGAGPDRYATGRPVPLLMQYLINRCE